MPNFQTRSSKLDLPTLMIHRSPGSCLQFMLSQFAEGLQNNPWAATLYNEKARIIGRHQSMAPLALSFSFVLFNASWWNTNDVVKFQILLTPLNLLGWTLVGKLILTQIKSNILSYGNTVLFVRTAIYNVRCLVLHIYILIQGGLPEIAREMISVVGSGWKASRDDPGNR